MQNKYIYVILHGSTEQRVYIYIYIYIHIILHYMILHGYVKKCKHMTI